VAAPTIGVLALQGDVREHRAHLEAVGVKTITVKSADELGKVHGLVIPGGESTTMSILAAKNHLLEPLRDFRANHPVYGSCAGLIMLADEILDGRPDQHTIGGLDITARRNAFGRQIDSFEIDLDIPALGSDPFHALFIRAPLVTRVGPNVEILATIATPESSEEPKRIVAVRQGNLLATSFHPEITPDLRLHKYFAEMVRVA
jgi:pyridoxal 5'-phosphate synthase pdxT subunit